ncbi:MAG: hypothetical protein ACUBOA_13630 [Candidatus Loosdrechtia sp.]|uniref:hypothetical protein n=1 Tax=Candidatus Loosdrechtia sp. TaxID=3101272 RepID=UPI003A733DF0|nr:MAG: hypothetical protein QY305_06770 [Candidatus Jettenia sp. AMX2]
MSQRIRPSDLTVFKVLESSARRCCICFGVNHDYSEKKGQIAHLDQDSSNSVYENLAWLCLSHHDDYDSKSSQTKNYSEYEVKKYRQALYDEVHRRRISSASGEEEERARLKRQFIEENVALFFFAASALYEPRLLSVLLNEIKDPDFREQIENAWSFLSQPVPDSATVTGTTRLDIMARHITSSKKGKEDLQTLLAIAGRAICAMSETDRNDALFSIHDDTIRSALMLIRKIQQDKK